MAKQQIAIEWKIVETLYDASSQEFYTKVTRLGKFTKATALEKMNGKFPTYKFKTVLSHGSSGYHVNSVGDTAELLPL